MVDLEKNRKAGARRAASLKKVDETSDDVKNDELLQAVIKYRNIAEKHDLFGLHQYLSETLPALAGESENH
jgi:hypothetical protein